MFLILNLKSMGLLHQYYFFEEALVENYAKITRTPNRLRLFLEWFSTNEAKKKATWHRVVGFSNAYLQLCLRQFIINVFYLIRGQISPHSQCSHAIWNRVQPTLLCILEVFFLFELDDPFCCDWFVSWRGIDKLPCLVFLWLNWSRIALTFAKYVHAMV